MNIDFSNEPVFRLDRERLNRQKGVAHIIRTMFARSIRRNYYCGIHLRISPPFQLGEADLVHVFRCRLEDQYYLRLSCLIDGHEGYVSTQWQHELPVRVPLLFPAANGGMAEDDPAREGAWQSHLLTVAERLRRLRE